MKRAVFGALLLLAAGCSSSTNRLYAPFVGVVGQRRMSVGETALPGVPVLTLLETARVKVRFSVPEQEIASVETDSRIRVAVPALGGSTLAAASPEKGAVANPAAHTYDVRASLGNRDGRLLPGMVCRVTVTPATALEEIAVPVRAVQQAGNGARFVWRVQGAREFFPSLLLAVLVIPFLEVLIIPVVQPRTEGKVSLTDRVQNLYRRVLAWTFRHGWLTISMGIASVVVALLIATQLKFRMMPFADRDQFAVEIYLRPDTPVERTAAVADGRCRGRVSLLQHDGEGCRRRDGFCPGVGADLRVVGRGSCPEEGPDPRGSGRKRPSAGP